MTTHNHEPAAGSHATHDRTLISAHAAGDLAGRDVATATSLLAACDECRMLHADLRTIALATRELPAPARAAGRDFRISPERAAVLARGGFWRRLLQPFGRPGGASRPLALAFTTLGVAGLLLAALPTFPISSGQSFITNAPEVTDGRSAIQATAQPAASPTDVPAFVPDAAAPGRDTAGGSEEPFGESDEPLGWSGYVDSGSGAGGGAAGAASGPTAVPTSVEALAPDLAQGSDGSTAPAPAPGPAPLVILSIAFLAAGLGLALLRVTALRLR